MVKLYRIKALFVRKEQIMGKNLKGRELGPGISQRKDGKYSARFLSQSGKRIEKYFPKVQEARKWLEEAKYQDRHGDIGSSTNMTVDAWFQYWITNIKENTIRYSTAQSYKDRYRLNVKDMIGDSLIGEIRPFHCQNVLNMMYEGGYAKGTIEYTKITMHAMFESAVENDIIVKNPVIKSIKCPGERSRERRVLTREEQQKFLEGIRDSVRQDEYRFILQTGLRVGELLALSWKDIDFGSRVIHVRNSLQYRTKPKHFVIGETKSEYGKRDIPLTEEAFQILQNQKQKKRKRAVASMEYNGLVFLNKKGEPTWPAYFNKELGAIADKIGIERFSMHTLRHTFATRCIEAGMRPKTLQNILGHSNISITMNLYVHVTDDEKALEMKKLEANCKMA